MRAELERKLRDAGLARVAAQAASRALASLRLSPAPAGAGGLSRLGGEPDLPAGMEWPAWRGAPLAFLAQLDLAELSRQEGGAALPRRGFLYVFYDADQRTWGFDPADRGSWRVLYFEGDERSLARRATPETVPEHARYGAVPLVAKTEWTLQDWETCADELGLSRRERDAYAELQGLEDDVRHRVLGHPDPVQGPMQLEVQLASSGIYVGDAKGYEDPRVPQLRGGAAAWKLLLQVDSEQSAGMMWGDVGRLYFWIRETDLAAARFDDVWMILQCS